MKIKIIFATLALIATFAFVVWPSSHAVAQTASCGALSHWNGRTCIGPKGKAYCPTGMTMQTDVCVADNPGAVTPMNRTEAPMGEATRESDHEIIIAMLKNLTAQESQQQAVINDLQQKMIAMQIVDNLMAANVEKARVAAQASAAAAQQGAANSQASIAQNGGVSQSQLMTNVNILIANDKTLLADDKALQTKQTDIARRLYYTCLRVQGIANGIDADNLNPNACTSTFWYKTPAPNWDTPFSNQ